jgi:hypothetical protein
MPETPPTKAPLRERLRDLKDRSARFGRELTAGMNRKELERLFDEEASRALTVLAGEEARRSETADDEDDFHRLVRLVRGFFLGIAFKLSPGRRALFVFSLLCPLFGLINFRWSIGPTEIYLDFGPFWFLTGLAGMTLLLALELVDRLRVRDELEVARQLQRELLPRRDPDIPGYRLAHSYRTANEIGGDYYDFLPLPDGRVAIAIGDASGHGMAAGLLMAIANATFKTALDLDPHPSAVLRLVNRVLCRTGGRREFMTLFCGVLDLATGELHYASAGHPFPLLRRARGTVEELGRGSLALGWRPDADFESARVTIEPGDYLVLYSDGLPEAVGGAEDDAFGFERLRRLLGGPKSPRELHDRILQAVDRHLGDRSLGDDLTLVVIERAPPLPAAPG